MNWNENLKKGLTFEDYFEFSRAVSEQEITPEFYKKEGILPYTISNHKRTERILSKIDLNKKLYNLVSSLNQKLTFVVINEPWCGDGSFLTPVARALEIAAAGNIDLRFLLRDENLNVMDNYLTNGGRAIPMLVVLGKDFEELFVWGPRPKPLQAAFLEWKQEDNFTTEEKIKRVNRWYMKDKGATVQEELLVLLKNNLK